MILSLNQMNDTNMMNNLLAQSVCLFVVAYAQNSDSLDEQLALGRRLKFKKGKVAMFIMSKNQMDPVNITKLPFPLMLMEESQSKPRQECIYFENRQKILTIK